MKIAIDLDDTIKGLTPCLNRFYNELRGTSFKTEDYKSQDLHETWGIPIPECRDVVNQFYASDHMKRAKALPNSYDVIAQMDKKHELLVITARPVSMRDDTRKWLDKRFPGYISDVYFSNEHFGGNGGGKHEICRKLDVDVIIEDNIKYALRCAEVGTNAMLLDWPWNQTTVLPKSVQRVGNWRRQNHWMKIRAIVNSGYFTHSESKVSEQPYQPQSDTALSL